MYILYVYVCMYLCVHGEGKKIKKELWRIPSLPDSHEKLFEKKDANSFCSKLNLQVFYSSH
jgi:hypothetical protein